jgi:DNA-binding transcriptional ArsR family regulator
MDEWREMKTSLKALGDLARLAIVYHLAHAQEVTVSELAGLLGISQPLVSWHLRRLRRAGIISTRRAGRQSHCSLNTHNIQQTMRLLERLIDPSFAPEILPGGEALLETELGLEE